jgi:transposase-like protein
MYRTIIERVIQRGSEDDWAAMLRYYGRDVVQQVVENAPYLSDAAIAAVCAVFGLKKEQLRSWQRKQYVPQTFNS